MVEGKPSDHDRLLRAPETNALASSDVQVVVNPSAKDKRLAEVDRTNQSSGSLTELNFKSQGLSREEIAARMDEQDESISIDYGEGRASRKSGLTEKDLELLGRSGNVANSVSAHDNKQNPMVSDATTETTQEQNQNENGTSFTVYSLEASQATRNLDAISQELTRGDYQESIKLNVQITNVPQVSPGVKPEDLLGFTNAVLDAGAKAVRPVEEHLAKPNSINNDLWNLPGGAAKGIWHFAQSPEQLNRDTAAITDTVIEIIDKPMMPEQRATAAGSLLPMFFFEGGGKPLDNAASKQMKLDQMTAEELKMLGLERKEMFMPEVPPELRHLELQPASEDLLASIGKKGREIVVAAPNSEDYRYLLSQGADASTGKADMMHILMKKHPSKIAALEEFLHGTQKRIGVFDRLGLEISEVKVKDFMLRHSRLLQLSENDLTVLRALQKQEELRALKRGFSKNLFKVGGYE